MRFTISVVRATVISGALVCFVFATGSRSGVQAAPSISHSNPTPLGAISIEFLKCMIRPENVKTLYNVVSRQQDHIVHLNIDAIWPSDKQMYGAPDLPGDKTLSFWADDPEGKVDSISFNFPDYDFDPEPGGWRIKGYFIPRQTFHHGEIVTSFERVADASVLLNPNVREVATNANGC